MAKKPRYSVSRAKPRLEAEIISLNRACQRAGISMPTALKLAGLGQFPEPTWLGGKRVLSCRLFDAWLTTKTGAPTLGAVRLRPPPPQLAR